MRPGKSNNIGEDTHPIPKILFPIIAAAFVSYSVFLHWDGVQLYWPYIILSVGSVCSFAIPYILMKKGHPAASAFSLITILLAILTGFSAIGQGAYDVATIAFPVVFIFAGLFLNNRYLAISFGLSLVAFALLVFGDSLGWLPVKYPIPHPDWSNFTRGSIMLAVCALAAGLMATNLCENTRKQKLAEHKLNERIKELRTLYGLSEIAGRKDVSLDGLYRAIIDILPQGWQYPDITCVRLVIDGNEFRTSNYAETPWTQSAPICVNNVPAGRLEIGYLEERPKENNGPFLKEETKLINDVALRTGEIIERKNAENEVIKLNHELEQRVIERTAELQASNAELEAFSYSISHDLRAPLRGIDGWSLALLEDAAGKLNDQEKTYLNRVRSEAQRLGELIDAILHLSRVTRASMEKSPVNLSELAEKVGKTIAVSYPGRKVAFTVQPDLFASVDFKLMESVFTNLLDNAWKFTGQHTSASIDFGAIRQNGDLIYYIRDNGVGFDMQYAKKIFGAFQRFHKPTEFPGTGIGLATVQRIIKRHGGKIWVESELGKGTTFSFTV